MLLNTKILPQLSLLNQQYFIVMLHFKWSSKLKTVLFHVYHLYIEMYVQIEI